MYVCIATHHSWVEHGQVLNVERWTSMNLLSMYRMWNNCFTSVPVVLYMNEQLSDESEHIPRGVLRILWFYAVLLSMVESTGGVAMRKRKRGLTSLRCHAVSRWSFTRISISARCRRAAPLWKHAADLQTACARFPFRHAVSCSEQSRPSNTSTLRQSWVIVFL